MTCICIHYRMSAFLQVCVRHSPEELDFFYFKLAGVPICLFTCIKQVDGMIQSVTMNKEIKSPVWQQLHFVFKSYVCVSNRWWRLISLSQWERSWGGLWTFSKTISWAGFRNTEDGYVGASFPLFSFFQSGREGMEQCILYRNVNSTKWVYFEVFCATHWKHVRQVSFCKTRKDKWFDFDINTESDRQLM